MTTVKEGATLAGGIFVALATALGVLSSGGTPTVTVVVPTIPGLPEFHVTIPAAQADPATDCSMPYPVPNQECPAWLCRTSNPWNVIESLTSVSICPLPVFNELGVMLWCSSQTATCQSPVCPQLLTATSPANAVPYQNQPTSVARVNSAISSAKSNGGCQEGTPAATNPTTTTTATTATTTAAATTTTTKPATTKVTSTATKPTTTKPTTTLSTKAATTASTPTTPSTVESTTPTTKGSSPGPVAAALIEQGAASVGESARITTFGIAMLAAGSLVALILLSIIAIIVFKKSRPPRSPSATKRVKSASRKVRVAPASAGAISLRPVAEVGEDGVDMFRI